MKTILLVEKSDMSVQVLADGVPIIAREQVDSILKWEADHPDRMIYDEAGSFFWHRKRPQVKRGDQAPLGVLHRIITSLGNNH